MQADSAYYGSNILHTNVLKAGVYHWDPTVSTGAGECRILSFKFSIMRGCEDRCDAQRHELEDFEHLPKDQILTM